ncbi:MAG: sce7726 family protein, partial [Clostridia bacterium]|nr:sce7726 family protein [Clostridia bacterium]
MNEKKKRHPSLLDRDIRPVLFEQFELSGERLRIMEEFVLCRKCRADAVMILPGQGIVGFEIKSDRDSLERLEHQVRDYSRFCDLNYLVTGARYV